MALGDQLKQRRLAHDLSLAELGRRAGVSKAYLHQLESATNVPRPSADLLYRIAFALGTSVGELLEKDLHSPGGEITDIPTALREFVIEERLDDEDIKMLAAIKYRGEQPRTTDDWRFLYESIKRSVPQERR